MTMIILDPPGYKPFKGELPPGAELLKELGEVDDHVTEAVQHAGLTPVGEAHAPNAELKDMAITIQAAAQAKLQALATQAGLEDS